MKDTLDQTTRLDSERKPLMYSSVELAQHPSLAPIFLWENPSIPQESLNISQSGRETLRYFEAIANNKYNI